MPDKHAPIQPDRDQSATAIHLVDKAGLDAFTKGLPAVARAALAAQKFTGAPFEQAVLPDGDGVCVVAGVADPAELGTWCLARLGETLPAGTYRLANAEPGAALFGWASGQYRFDRYRADAPDDGPRVLLTKAVKAIDPVLAEVAATALVRDLVNTPAEDMGPAQLEAEASRLAKAHKAELKVASGDALETGFPMVHAVGRAASRHHAPRLIAQQFHKAA